VTEPISMLLWCPECGERHVDTGRFVELEHHTHACQHCGHVWRPAIVPTRGVRFLPGFKGPSVVAAGRKLFEVYAERGFSDVTDRLAVIAAFDEFERALIAAEGDGE